MIEMQTNQDEISSALYEFMHEAVKHCFMGKPWPPEKIRDKGIELGLMVKKAECVYAYSDQIKNKFGQ